MCSHRRRGKMYDQVEAFVSGDMFISYHTLENGDIVTSCGEIEYLVLFD